MNTILTNCNIYTMDEEKANASAIVFNRNGIIYVGDDGDELKPYMYENAKVHNLGGKTVIPGIIDSHIHPGMVSMSSWHVRLPWTENAEEVLSFIKDYAEKHPKEEIPFCILNIIQPPCLMRRDRQKNCLILLYLIDLVFARISVNICVG